MLVHHIIMEIVQKTKNPLASACHHEMSLHPEPPPPLVEVVKGSGSARLKGELGFSVTMTLTVVNFNL